MNKRQPNLLIYGNVPIEYQALKSDLAEYASPKDKIDELVQQGSLIRLKRGWYVVSTGISGKPYCRGAIANTLYGPSYVSLETALSYYGIIPEKVYATLSVTTLRSKSYKNALGSFEYLHVPQNYYSIGITLATRASDCSYLIASPEKALCDTLYLLRGHRIRSKKAMREFLFSDMRVDLSALEHFDKDVLQQVIFSGTKVSLFSLLLEVLQDEFRS